MSQNIAREESTVITEQKEPALKLVDLDTDGSNAGSGSLDEQFQTKTPVLDGVEETINRLTMSYVKSGYAKYERGSVLRLFREQFRRYVGHLMEPEGGDLTLDKALKRASEKYDQKGALELMEELLKRGIDQVSYLDLNSLWACSPEEAELMLEIIKQEGQREFCTGHRIAKVFEPVDWFRPLWRHAQFLSIRDTFIAEFDPEGGVEFALIDTLTLAFFMQEYWARTCVTRTRENPVRESVEYEAWKNYYGEEAKQRKYDDGRWKLPFVSEDRAIHTSTEMLDLFSKLFQRTLRQLNNHQLAKLKRQKLKAEIRRLNATASPRD